MALFDVLPYIVGWCPFTLLALFESSSAVVGEHTGRMLANHYEERNPPSAPAAGAKGGGGARVDPNAAALPPS